MSARAIFAARLAIGEVEVPVRLFPAARDGAAHPRLVHAADRRPVRQELVHPTTGARIAGAAARRAYEVEPGRFVVFEPGELAALARDTDGRMVVAPFIARDLIPWARLERPYWVGPDGDELAYFALAQALGDSDAAGLVRWTMRAQRWLGALISEDDYLMVITLREAPPLSLPSFESKGRADLDWRQLHLAEQLVDALHGSFAPEELHNEYGAGVRALVARKAAGEPTLRLDERPAPATDDLSRALRASLRKELHVA